MTPTSKIFIAGSRGMVGSAIIRELQRLGYKNLLTPPRDELDLMNQAAVERFFTENQPEFVFLAAAKVGGTIANRDFPADFILSNLTIQNNVIAAAHRSGVRKLLFLGSTRIYPKLAPQPIPESALLTGLLEPTNEPYAIAKIAGIKMCQSFNRQFGTNFIAAMPTNLYGPNDNFDETTSHVLPALIGKFHRAKIKDESSVELWGTGSPRREFLHVDDAAAALIFMMKHFDPTPEQNTAGEIFLNVGSGEDLEIRELAEMVREVVGFTGEIHWDTSKPDGTPRKLTDISKIRTLGWQPQIPLRVGIGRTYQEFLATRP